MQLMNSSRTQNELRGNDLEPWNSASGPLRSRLLPVGPRAMFALELVCRRLIQSQQFVCLGQHLTLQEWPYDLAEQRTGFGRV